MGTRVTGSISAMLGNFDYMTHWGPFKTREEIIGKPIIRILECGERVSIGEITDADPTTDEWFGELYELCL